MSYISITNNNNYFTIVKITSNEKQKKNKKKQYYKNSWQSRKSNTQNINLKEKILNSKSRPSVYLNYEEMS